MLELRFNGDHVGFAIAGRRLTLPDGRVVSPAEEGWTSDDGYLLVAWTPPEPEPEPVDLVAYAAEKRWQRETGGFPFGGFHIATDDRSKLMLIGARAAADANIEFTTSWKMPGGIFVALNAPTILAISDAVLAHVAACFAIEEQVLTAIAAGTITTPAEIDAAFVA